VLIKNAEALERMKIDTLVVDKTGTLTEGRPSVTRIVPATVETERCGLPPAWSGHRNISAVVAAAKDRDCASRGHRL
jgi:Cu+-exporting ATPase